MKKSDLSEKQIENLLRDLPKVTDKRSPEEIYQTLTVKRTRKRLPGWLVPSVAASAALILLLILSPSLSGWQNSASNSEKAESGAELAKTEMKEESQDAGDSVPRNNQMKFSDVDDSAGEPNSEIQDGPLEQDQPTAVYSEDINGYNVLTYAIPEPNAQIAVPITVLVHSKGGETWFELFEQTMKTLQEEKWGLADYFPLNAQLSYIEETEEVHVDVPADHQYGSGSASETAFERILAQSLPYERVKKINFSTEGQKGIELGNTGNVTELQIKDRKRHAYYFYYPEGNANPYIVPAEESYDTVAEALQQMLKDRKELGLKASLPEQFRDDLVSLKHDEKVLLIKLADGSRLPGDFLHSLEAIMLTAKNFGFEAVRLENAAPDSIGPFDLSEDLPLPVGPNKKIIEGEKEVGE